MENTSMKKKMNIPVFIPHFGCGNDCVFCNQRKISGLDEKMALSEVRQTIQAAVETKNGRDVEIAFFGGSFTGLDLAIQKAYLDLAKEFVDKYDLIGIRMSTRPDYIDDEEMAFLSAYPVTAIELGVQSMDDEVLEKSKRNHSSQDVFQAAEWIHKNNIELGLQMMIGLPGDSEEKAMGTLDKLMELKPKTMRIYPTLVLEGTELADMYERGTYKSMELDEAVRLAAAMLPRLERQNIQLIRVGLQDNEFLQNESYIAGPYHPAFKELVMDLCFYNQVMKIYNGYGNKSRSDGPFELAAGSKAYQRCVGHKGENKKRFEEKGMGIRLDKNMEPHKFTVVVK